MYMYNVLSNNFQDLCQCLFQLRTTLPGVILIQCLCNQISLQIEIAGFGGGGNWTT